MNIAMKNDELLYTKQSEIVLRNDKVMKYDKNKRNFFLEDIRQIIRRRRENQQKMSSNREEEIQQKIDERSQKMLSYLTNENRSEQQIKKQFYFLAQTHEKNPFMNDADLMLFRSSIRNIQLQNVGFLSLSAALAFGIYKLSGGFTPNLQRPWLRRLRHASVIGIPSLLLPAIITAVYPGESQQNIIELSQKYKPALTNPEFNKKFVQNEAERYRQQLQKK